MEILIINSNQEKLITNTIKVCYRNKNIYWALQLNRVQINIMKKWSNIFHLNQHNKLIADFYLICS